MFESRRWQEASLFGCPTARTGYQGSLKVCQAFTQLGEDVTFKRQDRKNIIRKQTVIVQREGSCLACGWLRLDLWHPI